MNRVVHVNRANKISDLRRVFVLLTDRSSVVSQGLWASKRQSVEQCG